MDEAERVLPTVRLGLGVVQMPAGAGSAVRADSIPTPAASELRRLEKECGLLEREGRRLAAEVRQLHATQRFLLRQLAKEKRRRRRVRRSLSWQVTRPLRWLGETLRALVSRVRPSRPVVAGQSPATTAIVRRPIDHPADAGEIQRRDPADTVAVVVHAYYPELLGEIAAAVVAAGFPFDLFVTCPEWATEAVGADLRRLGIRDAEVTAVVNRGRDVAPFLRTLALVVARGHRVVLKLHTKQSAHRDDGAAWRTSLLSQLLAPAAAAAAIDALAAPGPIGIVGPQDHIVSIARFPGANLERVRQLAQAMGMDPDEPGADAFVAGTMFFARVDALMPLLRLGLDESDFEPELGQIDGMLAHAIERSFSHAATSAGYHVGSLDIQMNSVSLASPENVYEYGVSSA